MNLTELAVKTVYWFFLYGFIGWGVEVVYAAVKTHALVNRGFLCGPICPIYGFGMVGLIYSVSLIPLPDSGSMSAVAIFFIGMILTTAIELVGGWALFKIYHIRWWDYSNMKFNLGGYICPQFSLLWGLGSVLMIKVVHPLLARGSSPMPFNIMLIVDVVLLVLFVVDVAASTAAAIGLNKYLREIDELRAKLRVTSDKLTTVLGTGAMTADTILDEQKLQLALAKLEGRENADVLRAELTVRAAALREKLTAAEHDHLGTRRLLRAFPDMKSLNYADTLRIAHDATRAEIAAAVAHAIEAVDLQGREKTFISKLSGGQKKRVSIAMELLANPRLLILDEPTSGLSPDLDRSMMELCRRLSHQNCTVLMVTHNMSNINLCDKIAFLGVGGVLCYYGAPEKLNDYFDVEMTSDIFEKLRDPAQIEHYREKYFTTPEFNRLLAVCPEAAQEADKRCSQ